MNFYELYCLVFKLHNRILKIIQAVFFFSKKQEEMLDFQSDFFFLLIKIARFLLLLCYSLCSVMHSYIPSSQHSASHFSLFSCSSTSFEIFLCTRITYSACGATSYSPTTQYQHFSCCKSSFVSGAPGPVFHFFFKTVSIRDSRSPSRTPYYRGSNAAHDVGYKKEILPNSRSFSLLMRRNYIIH